MRSFFAVLLSILFLSSQLLPGSQALPRAKRAINPFLDSMGKRALNPFLDSIGKRSVYNLEEPEELVLEKRYFDSLAGQSLGKRSAALHPLRLPYGYHF